MATPIKSALNFAGSRKLSPISPSINSILSPKGKTCSRHLEFITKSPSSPRNRLRSKSNDFLMNTPNKSSLLKYGAQSPKLNVIGKGTFGTVVQGVLKDTVIAVKVVKLNNHNEILPESNVLGLTHDNIVKIIDITVNNVDTYGIIMMELQPNAKELQAILEDNEALLDIEIIKKYIKDICTALDYCHQNGILHLDVKPKNILVCGEGCKLCDFGNSYKLTQSHPHVFRGTVAYAAPELLTGISPNVKCDIYSLGIVLWQMKFRDRPYKEYQSNEVIIYKVVKFNLRPSCPPLVNNDFEKLFKRCWDSVPSSRPELTEVINILDKCSSL